MPLENPALRHGNGAGLLGHYHNNGIGDLRHADPRPVPGTQLRGQMGVIGQGQHAPRRRNPSLPDDGRAVMQRGLGEEDVAQQLLGGQAIDGGAGFEILIQLVLPLKDDEGAHLLPAHVLAGKHGLGDDGIHLLGGLVDAEEASQLDGAQVVDHLPELRLEQHHKGQKSNGQELAQNPVEGMQLHHIGDPCRHHQQHHRPGQPHGVGRTHQG